MPPPCYRRGQQTCVDDRSVLRVKDSGKAEAVSAILRLSEDVSGCKIFRLLTMAQKRTHPAARKPHPGARRKPRADAQRNRERILEMAKQAFTRSGADASLDDIATQAGVGAGTLYRHFPTREALLAAVYRTEVEKLAAAEKRLVLELAPLEALRAWMLLFVDYIATKKIIAPALKAMVGEHSRVIEDCYAQIQGAIRALVKRAIAGGEMRSDIDPVDLLKALVGAAYMSDSPDWQQSARRLVDILISGSRPVR